MSKFDLISGSIPQIDIIIDWDESKQTFYCVYLGCDELDKKCGKSHCQHCLQDFFGFIEFCPKCHLKNVWNVQEKYEIQEMTKTFVYELNSCFFWSSDPNTIYYSANRLQNVVKSIIEKKIKISDLGYKILLLKQSGIIRNISESCVNTKNEIERLMSKFTQLELDVRLLKDK